MEQKLNVPEKDLEAEWGRAFFVGPAEQIVACAEDGESTYYYESVFKLMPRQFRHCALLAN